MTPVRLIVVGACLWLLGSTILVAANVTDDWYVPLWVTLAGVFTAILMGVLIGFLAERLRKKDTNGK